MKARYIFIAALVFGVMAIFGLRYNNTHAQKLKTQILEKDSKGQGTKEDLLQLRNFVFGHMNSTTRVELTGAYERDLAKAKAGQRDDIYAKAQASCDKQGVSSVAQAKCVQRYLAANSQGQDEVTIEKSNYIYSFASPGLSFDIAGFGLMGAVVLGVASLAVYSMGLFNARLDQTL